MPLDPLFEQSEYFEDQSQEKSSVSLATEAVGLPSVFFKTSRENAPALPELTIAGAGKDKASGKLLLPDGSVCVTDGKTNLTTISKVDGSSLILNAQGQVLELNKVNGEELSFGYDANGVLSSVAQKGHTWRRVDEQTWSGDNGKLWHGIAVVTPDGKYIYADRSNVVVTEETNGDRTVVRPSPQTSCKKDRDGRVIETIDRNGTSRKYGYDKEGHLKTLEEKRTGAETSVVTLNRGVLAATNEHLRVNEKDGALIRSSFGKTRIERLNEAPIEINQSDIKEKAKALHESIPRNHSLTVGILKDMSEPEREALKNSYKQVYGTTLDSRVAAFKIPFKIEAARVALNKVDGKPDYAGNLLTAVLEMKENGDWDARSKRNCEREIRDIFARLNSEQIIDLKREYASRAKSVPANGTQITGIIVQDLRNMSASDSTMKSLDYLMRGSDADNEAIAEMNENKQPRCEKLLDVAIKCKDEYLAEEALRCAPAEARVRLLEKYQETIKHSFPNQNVARRILDYAHCGRLSEASQVIDNMHNFGDNVQGIEQALHNMPESSRRIYMAGKKLESKQSGPEILQRTHCNCTEDEARAYYRLLHQQLSRAAGTNISGSTNEWRLAQMSRWQDLIAVRGGTLVSELANHCGIHWDSRFATIDDAIRHAPDKQIDTLRKLDPEARSERLEAVRQCLSIFKKPFEVDNLMSTLQTRMSRKEQDSLISNDMMITFKELSAKHSDSDELAKDWLRLMFRRSEPSARIGNEISNLERFEKCMTNRAWAETFNKDIGSRLQKDHAEFLKSVVVKTPPSGAALLDLFGDSVDGIAEAAKIMSTADRADASQLANSIWSLYPSRQQVARYIIAQGKAQPEDIVRGFLCDTGFGGSKERITGYLRTLSSEQRREMICSFAEKYSKDLYGKLSSDGGSIHKLLYEKLGANIAEPLLTARGTATELVDRSLYQFSKSYDGAGRWLVDSKLGDGTGHQARDAANNLVALEANFSSRFEELRGNREFMDALSKIHSTLKEFRASKNLNSEALMSSLLVVAAAAGAPFGSLAAIVAAGAFLKCAGKRAIQGVDYDPEDTLLDAITGATDAVVNVIGPGHLSKVFGLGSTAAGKTAEKLTMELGKQAIEKQAVQEAIEQVMRKALVSGQSIDDRAIDQVVRSIDKSKLAADVTPAKLRELVGKTLVEELQPYRTTARQFLRDGMLVSASNGLGGATSGAVRGFAEWDFSLTTSQNLERLATYTSIGLGAGAIGGAVFNVGTKGVGIAVGQLRRAHTELGKSKSGSEVEARILSQVEPDVLANTENPASSGATDKPTELEVISQTRRYEQRNPTAERLKQELSDLDAVVASYDAEIHSLSNKLETPLEEPSRHSLTAIHAWAGGPKITLQEAAERLSALKEARTEFVRRIGDRRRVLEIALDYEEGVLSPGTYMFKGKSGELSVTSGRNKTQPAPLKIVRDLIDDGQRDIGNHQDPLPAEVVLKRMFGSNGEYYPGTGVVDMNLELSRPWSYSYGHEIGHLFDEKILQKIGSQDLQESITNAYETGLQKGALDVIAKIGKDEKAVLLEKLTTTNYIPASGWHTFFQYAGCRDEVIAEMYNLYRHQQAQLMSRGKKPTYPELVSKFAEPERREIMKSFDDLYELLARDAFPKLRQPRNPFAKLLDAERRLKQTETSD